MYNIFHATLEKKEGIFLALGVQKVCHPTTDLGVDPPRKAISGEPR